MTLFTFEAITTFGGISASVVASVAGFFKFRAWWLDRTKQARMESAGYLKEKGSEPWQVELGAEQLLRLHFESLTGIDRTSGHEAIRRCHQRLGGTDREWMLLRGVGQFLVATGHTARVRKPRRRDHAVFAIGAVAAFLAGLLGVAIVAAAASFLEKTPSSAVRVMDVLMILAAIVWASTFALVAWASARHGMAYLSARNLYRDLFKLRQDRRMILMRNARPSISEHKKPTS